jgi:hypothetical protein
MPTERVMGFLRKMRGIASNALCPSCGAGTWDYVEDTVTLYSPPDGGYEVYPLVCQNCGHVNLYSVQHLEGVDNFKGNVKLPPE